MPGNAGVQPSFSFRSARSPGLNGVPPGACSLALLLGLAAVMGCQSSPSHPQWQVTSLPEANQFTLREHGQPIANYRYGVVRRDDLQHRIASDNLKYAVPRSDYLDPLYGPEGETLTLDWPIDHPHHRGIYWAWPEVDWRGRRGDLHALQHVFARPTGHVRTRESGDAGMLVAENLWHWEDGTPIVRELAEIRAHSDGASTRFVDLTLRFEALGDEVSLARRETDKYGGLNLRFNTIREQQLLSHCDTESPSPRAAWAQVSGIFGTATRPATVVILQHPENPDYPGDWVQFPTLNWMQPTFPAARTRFVLRRGKPLTLAFRLCIRAGGPLTETEARAQWTRFGREVHGLKRLTFEL